MAIGNKKSKNQRGISRVTNVLWMFLLIAGVGITVFAVKQNQDSRSRANTDIVLPIFFTSVSWKGALNAKIQEFSYPPELTPFFVNTGNGNLMYFLSSAWTWECQAPQTMLKGALIPLSSCSLTTQPEMLSSVDLVGNPVWRTPQTVPTTADWKFSYDGVTGAVLDTQGTDQRVVAVRHDEHTNAAIGNNLYQGRINTNVSATTCAAGYKNGVYQQCWDAYNQFITLGWTRFNAQAGWSDKAQMEDQGPIIWPSTGYIKNGQKVSGGFYQPTLFSSDPYLYTFFVDNNDIVYGEQKCIAAARSPLASFGAPGTWKNFYNGDFTKNSLPPGFTKENIAQFYSVAGGKMSCINRPDSFNDSAIWFSVAKVKNSPYYLAVEETSPNLRTWQIGIRLSTDLVNWSPLFRLDRAYTAWGDGDFSYPTFLSEDGTSESEIDPNDFYIIGKHATNSNGYELNAIRLSVHIDGFNPLPRTLTREEKIVHQYYHELLGWDLSLDDPAVEYHANFLKNNGCLKDIKGFITATDFVNGPKAKLNNIDYVGMLYRAILSRNPDGLASGSQWWIDRLNAGDLNRDTIVDKMYESSEAQSVCNTGKVIQF